jgi:hypothetical protein
MAELPQREWLERFASRTLMLEPALSVLGALRQAISAFPDASHLNPEEAAKIFAVDLPLSTE